MDSYFVYDKTFLSREESNDLLAFARGQTYVDYPFRNGLSRRTPKVEFREHPDVGAYRFGQLKTTYRWGFDEFPSILKDLKAKVGDPRVNHIMIIRYTDGNTHFIPWHQDRQQGNGSKRGDILEGASIHVITVSEQPRRYQLAFKEDVPGTYLDATRYVFDEPTVNGSLFTLTERGNKEMMHRIPVEKGWKGERYSIVLRTLQNRKA